MGIRNDLVEKVLDQEVHDYLLGFKNWRIDVRPAKDPYKVRWEGLLALMYTGFDALREAHVVHPYMAERQTPYYPRPWRKMRENDLEQVARFTGWLKTAARLKGTQRFFAGALTDRGADSPYHLINLWNYATENPSPHKVGKVFLAVQERAHLILKPLGLKVSNKAVAKAMVQKPKWPVGKMAMAAVMLIFIKPKYWWRLDEMNYRSVRELVTDEFMKNRTKRLLDRQIPRAPWEFVAPWAADVDQYEHWKMSGWVPRSRLLFTALSYPKLITFAGVKNSGRKLRQLFNENRPIDWAGSAAHQLVALANLVIFFNGDIGAIKGYIAKGAANEISVHDLGINLFYGAPGAKDQIKWLTRVTEKPSHMLIHKVSLIISKWDNLVLAGWNPNGKNSVESAATIETLDKYAGAQSIEFATESAKWDISTYHYQEWENWWLKDLLTLKAQYVPAPGGISGISSKSVPSLRLIQLEKSDPRAVYVGNHTGCCQHPEGVGSTCAWFSHSSEHAAVWVAEFRGKIMAQSFVWRDEKNNLILDNIEALGHEKYADEIADLFMKASKSVIGRLGIEHVYQGTGHNDIELASSSSVALYSPKLIGDFYTDASLCWRVA